MAAVTKDEFLEWKRHPVTKVVFDMLKERVEYNGQVLAHGNSLGDNIVQNTCVLVGRTQSLTDLMAIDYEEVEGYDTA